jgi:undecaprenyl diphosphate synthase
MILDGNGRWAKLRGLPRAFGHRAGASRAEECIRAAPDLGISHLTMYAFSTENWKRAPYEITSIFRLLRLYFGKKANELKEQGVRVRFIGRRDKLDDQIKKTMVFVEELTSSCTRLQLNIAVDYGGQDEIVRTVRAACEMAVKGNLASHDINEELISSLSDLSASPPPDLIIRTGGDKRLSNFLLWHSAYSELEFCNMLWPDFKVQDLSEIVDEFRGRDRRFGTA